MRTFSENPQISSRSSDMAATACKELFSAYGLELAAGNTGWRDSTEQLISGVMGFIGPRLRGTCLLAAERTAIEVTCPPEGRLRDWVGELSNQLVGRLKKKMLDRGIEVALTTPIVLTGVRLQPLPRGAIEPTAFNSASGYVLVWLEVEASEDASLDSERPGPADPEIDLLLF